MKTTATMLTLSVMASAAVAAPTATTTHNASNTGLDGSIVAGDVLSGLIAAELAGDNGWHPANPASGNSLNANGLPAFTDDRGDFSGVTGLLNDFPGPGNPTKRVRYDLPSRTNIKEIQVLTGNAGNDGRVFSTTVISTSSNGGSSFSQLGYFQSDPSGTTNNDGNPAGFPGPLGATLVEITDDQGGALAKGVTNIIFEFYAVDNTQGEMRDPFDGVNPFTGADDGLTAAFVSPLVYEIDAIRVPEPASGVLLLLGLAGLTVIGRRR